MCEKNILKMVAMICITIIAVVIAIKEELELAFMMGLIGIAIIILDWEKLL